jgi:DNA-binding IclR family transcriptional regulator
MTHKRLPEAVKRALEDAPVSLREIADEAGLPPSTVTRLKDGIYQVHERHAEAILEALEALRDRHTKIAKHLDASAKRIRRAQRGRKT